VIAVVASERDPAVAALLDRWAPHAARVLSPRDLSTPGWRHHVGGAGEEWAVVSAERVPAGEIRGVLTRLPRVGADDLLHIVPEDRDYVAAEMNAFLLSWLTRLGCPVVNRPTATSLMGRNLGRERWLVLAARAGLPIAPARAGGADAERPRAFRAVTVVADRWVGDVAPLLGERAVRLAGLAGLPHCTVRFDGPDPGAAFTEAELFTDLADPRVADALLAHLGERGRA
jgi:hypothetical protein